MRTSPVPVPVPAVVGTVAGGRYRVIQLLGSGGTGQVYLAEQCDDRRDRKSAAPQRRVAIKVLRAEHRAEPELVARFDREAAAAARIHHPNVRAVVGAPMPAGGE
ncbi:MAG: protein kinase, partial [Byssovorax sp.]